MFFILEGVFTYILHFGRGVQGCSGVFGGVQGCSGVFRGVRRLVSPSSDSVYQLPIIMTQIMQNAVFTNPQICQICGSVCTRIKAAFGGF